MTSQIPEPKGVKVTVNDTSFYIPEWNMETQISNSPIVMPLISEPMANAAAVAGDDDDKGIFAAAIIHGITKALGQADLSVTIPRLLNGVTYVSSKGVPQMASIKTLEQEGFKFHHLLRICAEVIKVNVGPLFEDGLQDLMGM